MKKLARGVAAVLAAVMLLSCAVFAADSDKPTVTATDSEATTVAFVDNDCTQLTLTYKSDAIVKDGLYLLRVVKDDGSGNYVPTESTILDIRQVQATEAGSVSFTEIYPKEIANSALVISGNGLDEPVVVATIQLPYTLGDIDNNGSITLPDAIMVLKHNAKLITLTGTQFLAGDVTEDGSITLPDAILILKYVAKLISGF